MSLNLDPLHRFSSPELNRPASAVEIEQLVAAVDSSLTTHDHPDIQEIQNGFLFRAIGDLRASVQSKWLFDHQGNRVSTQLAGSVILVDHHRPKLIVETIQIETESDYSPGEIDVKVGGDNLYSEGAQTIGYQVLSFLQSVVAADRDKYGADRLLDSPRYQDALRVAQMPLGQDLRGLSSSQAEEVRKITADMSFVIDDARNAVFQRYFRRRILDDNASVEVSTQQLTVREQGIDEVRSLHTLDATQSRPPDYINEHTAQIIIANRERVYPVRTKTVSLDEEVRFKDFKDGSGTISLVDRETKCEVQERQARRGDIVGLTQLLKAAA